MGRVVFLGERTNWGLDVEYLEKRAVVEELLENWEHFFAVASSGLIVPAEPDSSKVLPDDWTLFSSMSKHHSVVELRRCLGVLADKMPKHYAQVAGWYGAERKGAWGTRKVKTNSGRWTTEPARVRARVLPYWLEVAPKCSEKPCPCENVKPRMLCRSVDIVLGLWSPRVSLKLPRPLQRKLREMVDADGTHMTEAA